MENKIPIYIADEDAQKFMLFQKHYDIFTILIDKKVFETKNGSVSLNFDRYGVLQSVQRADFLYYRKFEGK